MGGKDLDNKAGGKDPRFKVAKREAWIGIGLVLFNFLWWFGFAYGMGSGPVEEYTYIMGLPAWFFYSCVAGFAVVFVLVWAAVKFLFKEVPFDDSEEGGKAE
ncbi:YhdT family protein [Bacillus infantis]|uniref:YhdT family protein n=1 Tax=Bacillus infantis TaxID=324767 RepID=UPI003CEC899F